MTLLALLLYVVLMGLCLVLFGAAAGALKEGIRRGGRRRGLVVTLAALALALLGMWALLI